MTPAQSKTKRLLLWALGGLLFLGGLALLVAFFLTKSRGLGKLAADAIEAAHVGKIKTLETKIERLSEDLDANMDEVRKAEAEVEKKKADLKAVYTTVGLPPEERRARFAKLRI